MSRIPVYNNELTVNEKPLADAAHNAGQSGFYKGQMIRQGFDDLARGVNQLQAGLTKDETADAQEEISNLTSDVATAQADLAVQWKQVNASAGLEDSGAAQDFLENVVNPRLDSIGAGIKTQKGRNYFTKARARLAGSMYVTTNADQMNRISEGALAKFKNVGDQYTVAADADPLGWKDHIEQMNDAVDASDDVHKFGGLKAQELKNERGHQIAMTAAERMVHDNPDVALEAIAKGEFDKYITGPDKLNLEEKARTRKDQIEADAKTSQTAADNKRKNEAQVALNELQLGVKFDPKTGRFDIPEDFMPKLDAVGQKYKDVLSVADIQARREWAAGEVRGSNKITTSDKATEDALRLKMHEGELTMTEVLEARTARLLSDKTFNQLLAGIGKSTGEKRELKQAEETVKGMEDFVMGGMYGTLNKLNGMGAVRVQDFNADMMDVYADMQDSGLKGAELEQKFKEYVRAAVPSYQLKLGTDPTKLPPDITAPNWQKGPIRLPGETGAQYLKRLNDEQAGNDAEHSSEVLNNAAAGTASTAVVRDDKMEYTGDAKQAVSFLESRGGFSPKLVDGKIVNTKMDAKVNPVFAERLAAAVAAAEVATGAKAKVGETYRPVDVQGVYYDRYKKGQGGLAARPGKSRHQRGNAADLAEGPVLDWLHEHAAEYGLEFLKGHAFEIDSGHIQLAESAPVKLAKRGQ